MTIKDKINEMIEQYSITHDNPTVLRELIKLGALTQVVIDWVNNNDPTDLTAHIKQINDRMDEIEELVRALNLEEINTELEALRASVADAVSKAAQALTESGQAVSKAGQALTKAGQVETSLDAYKTSNDRALDDLDTELTEAVTNAGTKADAAMALADGADTNASNALTKADNALTKSEQAVMASGTAINAAGEATAKAESVEQALSGKQDTLTFDQAPTADSQNPVTSGGVYKAIRSASIELDDNVTQTSQNGVKSSGIYKFVMDNSGCGMLDQLQEQISELSNTKQDKLTFDQAPTADSPNPVTSGGVYAALQGSGGSTITLDDTVTAESQNGVKSSGIHAAIEAARASLAAMITAANAVIESHTDDITALQEFQTTQDTVNETHNTQIAANKKAVDDLTVTVTDNEESVNTRFTELNSKIIKNEIAIERKQAQLYSQDGDMRLGINEEVDKSIKKQTHEHSSIPTTSAVYNALQNKQDKLTFDQAPTADSPNPVTSGGVYAALQGSGGSTITLDDTVTAESQNGVKSSGIHAAIEAAQMSNEMALRDKQALLYSTHNNNRIGINDEVDKIIKKQTREHRSIPTTSAVYNALKNKQDTLTFDQAPTADSPNPVTSGGVYAALQGAVGGGMNIKAGNLAFNHNESTQRFRYSGSKNVLAVLIKMQNSTDPLGCQVLAINGQKQSFIPVSIYDTNTNILKGLGTLKDMWITAGTLDIPETFEIFFGKTTPYTFNTIVDTGNTFFCIYTD